MTEAWGIALFSTVASLYLASLGWIAVEIRAFRKEIKHFVPRDECASDMGKQCDQIGGLFKNVNELSQRVTRVETLADTYHNHKEVL